jgi:hypothetical protein
LLWCSKQRAKPEIAPDHGVEGRATTILHQKSAG